MLEWRLSSLFSLSYWMNTVQIAHTWLASSLHQYLPCIGNIVMDLVLNFGANHNIWATTVRAGHTGRRAK